MKNSKWCKHCNQMKPVSAFRPKSGYICKPCESHNIAEKHSRTKHYAYQDGNNWGFLSAPWTISHAS